MSLSILIATVPERHEMFKAMELELFKQDAPFGGEEVEILFDATPRKDMPIGVKRNALLARATKTHLVFADDDDHYYDHYVSDIMEALKTDPDCVGCVIDHTIDGVPAPQCVHSKRFRRWSNGAVNTPGFGVIYQRNVTHRNPVRTLIARQVGFPEIRFGEDQPYSNGVTRLCRTEEFIERPGFLYRYSTKEEHNQKYGIR